MSTHPKSEKTERNDVSQTDTTSDQGDTAAVPDATESESSAAHDAPTRSSNDEPKKPPPSNRPPNGFKGIGKVPVGPGNFWNNMLTTVLALVMVVVIFSYLSDTQEQPEELTLSQVVAQVKACEVSEI